MASNQDSEARLHKLIPELLSELGWNTRSIKHGGQLYAQAELRQNSNLKEALGLRHPEYIVEVDHEKYWVIEAKRDARKLPDAIKQAKTYARSINSHESISCPVITGVAGSPDSTIRIETMCLKNNRWTVLTINNREATGFITPEQMRSAIEIGSLPNYDIDENLFNQKTQDINSILHQGAINKRNRAATLACVLLALAADQNFVLKNSGAKVLIEDINARAKSLLDDHGKGEFFSQIQITLPQSGQNHKKHMQAINKTIEKLRSLNIASAIDSGRDVLGQFYEQFLKYANDAKEIGIVLTPRHITKWAANMLSVGPDDIVFDPACGTGGFLVASLDVARHGGGGTTQGICTE